MEETNESTKENSLEKFSYETNDPTLPQTMVCDRYFPNEKNKRYLNRVVDAISTAYQIQRDPYNLQTKLHYWILNKLLVPQTPIQCKILINELVKSDTNALFLGCEKDKGTLLISALNNNDYNSFFVVEDFGGPIFSKDIEERFKINCMALDIDYDHAFTLFKKPQYSLSSDEKGKIKNINLLVYDAGRSIQDYEKMFSYYYDNLDDIFILYVCNAYNSFTLDGLSLGMDKANLEMLHEFKFGFGSKYFEEDFFDWGGGIYIMVLRKRI